MIIKFFLPFQVVSNLRSGFASVSSKKTTAGPSKVMLIQDKSVNLCSIWSTEPFKIFWSFVRKDPVYFVTVPSRSTFCFEEFLSSLLCYRSFSQHVLFWRDFIQFTLLLFLLARFVSRSSGKIFFCRSLKVLTSFTRQIFFFSS